MAEIKNTFLKGKMNKDLDARLVPNGEYREATNLQVSRSEGSTVGEFENILGSQVVATTGGAKIKIIGYFADKTNNIIYFFATDHYNDSTPVARANGTNRCEIHSYNIDTNVSSLLVEGYWLNFNQAFPVYGVNLLEELLFWTDNLNQPRKINISKANPTNLSRPTYYYNEDQISVAKYYPFEPIIAMERNTYRVNASVSNSNIVVLDQAATNIKIGDIVSDRIKTGTIVISSLITVIEITATNTVKLSQAVTLAGGFKIDFSRPSMENQSSEYVSNYSLIEAYSVAGTAAGSNITIVTSLLNSTPTIGMYVVCPTNPTVISSSGLGATPANTGVITSVTITGSDTIITLDVANDIAAAAVLPDLLIGRNPNYDPQWKGDPDLLKQEYVRFSYRIKFIDNEYSLMAPFSQIMFIPEQYGLFGKGIKTQLEDMNDAYQSTIVSWMQNNVDNILLRIPVPKIITSSQSLATPTNVADLISSLHIDSIDILYKESDSLAVKVLDTVQVTNATVFTSIIYEDLVHFANTVKYIDYNYESSKPYKTLPENQTVRVYDKVPVKALSQEVIGNRIVYGNYVDKHSSPLSSNYGVTIADKSVVYDNYTQFPNSSLKENRTYQVGLVLSDRYGRQSNVILSSQDDNPNQPGSTVFSPYKKYLDNDVFNWLGDAFRVTFNAAVPVENPGPGIWATTTPLGWFSYKTVVKQQEQDYYNVYLPGFVNGYPVIQDIEQNQTAFTVLSGDNINKVPRDLTEVSGQQTQFNSSVRLFGRVNNPDLNMKQTGTPILPYTNHPDPWNQQYYPNISSEFVRNIATVQDGEIQTSPFKAGKLASAFDNSTGTIPWGTTPGGTDDDMAPLYNGDANPYFAELSVGQRVLETSDSDPVNASRNRSNQLGAICTNTAAGTSGAIITMQPFLTISETDPTVSLLDIFWETSSTGNLVDLNATIDAQYEGIITTTDTELSFFEDTEPETAVDASFSFVDGGGTPRTNLNSAVITSIADNLGNAVDVKTFELRLNAGGSAGTYGLYTGDATTTGLDAYFWYGTNSPQINNYTITFTTNYTAGSGTTYSDTISTMNVKVKNRAPETLVANQCPITLTGVDAPSVNDTSIFNFITGETVGGTAAYGKWVNGSADVNNYQQELIFSIISQVDTSGAVNIFEFATPSNGALTVKSGSSLVTGQTYTINVGITDNNGVTTGVTDYTGIQSNCSLAFTVGAQHVNRAVCNGIVSEQPNTGCGNYRQIWAFVNSSLTSPVSNSAGFGSYPSTGIPTIFYGTSNNYTYYNVAVKYSSVIIGSTSNGGLNSGATMFIEPTLRFTPAPGSNNPGGNVYYTIEYRPNTGTNWSPATYYQYQPGGGSLVQSSGSIGTANFLNGSYISGAATDYKTRYWFNVPGEYRVLTSYVQGAICNTSDSNKIRFFPAFGDGVYDPSITGVANNCNLGPL